MRAGGLTDVHLLVAAGLLTVAIAAGGAMLATPDGPAAVAPSSFSASAAGGKAAYLTLRELGYTVERSFEPLTALAATPERSILVMTGPELPSNQDRRALRTFLEHGGVALLVGAPGAHALGVETNDGDPDGSPVRHRVVAASPLAANADEITLAPGPSPVLDASFVAVFTQPDGRPLVATAAIGAGRAVWLASATPLMNEHIRSAGNLQLLLNILGDPDERVVIWDEHYHGYTRSLWSYAAGTPLPWLLAQAALLALAGLAVTSRRSGPVRGRAADPRTSPLEFIDMLQSLYRKANATPAAVGAALARFRRAVAASGGVPANANDAATAAAAAARLSMDAPEIVRLLDAARRAAADPQVDRTAALNLTARLQELTAELQRRR